MNDCYLNNYEKFDWLIFYDIDEYIFLKNYDKENFMEIIHFILANFKIIIRVRLLSLFLMF